MTVILCTCVCVTLQKFQCFPCDPFYRILNISCEHCMGREVDLKKNHDLGFHLKIEQYRELLIIKRGAEMRKNEEVGFCIKVSCNCTFFVLSLYLIPRMESSVRNYSTKCCIMFRCLL